MTDINYSEEDLTPNMRYEEDGYYPGKTSHAELVERNIHDQHTIGSITALEQALMDASRLKTGIITDGVNSWNMITQEADFPDYAPKSSSIVDLGDFGGSIDTIGGVGLPDVACSVAFVNAEDRTMSWAALPFRDKNFIIRTEKQGDYFIQQAWTLDNTQSASRVLRKGGNIPLWSYRVDGSFVESIRPRFATSHQGLYTTKAWGEGTYDEDLNVTLPRGYNVVWAQFIPKESQAEARTAYLQFQIQGGSSLGLSATVYYDQNSTAARNRMIRTVCIPIYADNDHTVIKPYFHTDTNGIEFTVRIAVMNVRNA